MQLLYSWNCGTAIFYRGLSFPAPLPSDAPRHQSSDSRHSILQHVILLSDCSFPLPAIASTIAAGSDHTVCLILNSDYSMIIRFVTLFTPFTSLAYLAARSFSAVFFALPANVTTPLFVVTEVRMALVEQRSRIEPGHQIRQRRERRKGCKKPDDHRVDRIQDEMLYDHCRLAW